MKWITLPVIFFYLLTNADAQPANKPWTPFPFGQVSYYKSSDRSFYTISPDSVIVIGNDTIIYLNRKLYPGESLCSQPGSRAWAAFYGLYDDYTFPVDSFITNGDTTKFPGYTGFSEWNFNQPLLSQLNLNNYCDNYIYAYDSAYYDPQLQDSVRRISQFTSLQPLNVYRKNVIQNTLHHGLLQLLLSYDLSVCVTGSIYKLCGYVKDTAKWGFQPPVTRRYFNYYPGDILLYHNTDNEPPSYFSSGYERDSVESIEISGDSIKLLMYAEIRSKIISGNDSTDTVINTQKNVVYLMSVFKQLMNRTTLEPAFYYDTSTYQYVYKIILSEDTSSCITDTTIQINLSDFTFTNCTARINGTYNSSEIYSTIFGYKSSSSSFAPGGGYSSSTLIGYKSPAKNIYCGDYFPLSVRTVSANEAINIFPNPTSNIITISLPQNAIHTELVIYDLLGSERRRVTAFSPLLQIDISGLENGMYFIRSVDGNNNEVSKFTVVRY